jgi:hypothetical protein
MQSPGCVGDGDGGGDVLPDGAATGDVVGAGAADCRAGGAAPGDLAGVGVTAGTRSLTPGALGSGCEVRRDPGGAVLALSPGAAACTRAGLGRWPALSGVW